MSKFKNKPNVVPTAAEVAERRYPDMPAEVELAGAGPAQVGKPAIQQTVKSAPPAGAPMLTVEQQEASRRREKEKEENYAGAERYVRDMRNAQVPPEGMVDLVMQAYGYTKEEAEKLVKDTLAAGNKGYMRAGPQI